MTPAETIEKASPRIVAIPLSQIRPNPHQPRQVIAQEAIDLMTESLLAIGQQTPAKVRKVSEEGQPDVYELIGGHIRFAGAQKAGLATLDCLVLEKTSEQAELAALMDNQSTDMHWLDWVLAIERLDQGRDEPKQAEIAAKLGLSQTRVSFALKLAKVLSQVSRELIYYRVINSGPESASSEKVIRALADLGDPQRVEEALRVVLDKGMTESQARALVSAMKAGKPAGEHVPVAKRPKSSSQVTADSSQPETSKVQHSANTIPSEAPEETKVLPILQPSSRPMGGVGSLTFKALAGLPLLDTIKAKLKKGEALTWGDKLVVTLHSLALVAGWLWKHLLFPTLKFLQKAVLWAARSLWGIFRSSTRSLFRLVAPVLLVILLVWVGWNWAVNHVSPGEQLKRLAVSTGAWVWSLLPFHSEQTKTSSPPTANSSQQSPSSQATADSSRQATAQTSEAPVPQSGGPQVHGEAPKSTEGQALGVPGQAAKPQKGPGATQPQAAQPVKKEPQGDALSQAGDAVGKAAGGIGAAKKLFGF